MIRPSFARPHLGDRRKERRASQHGSTSAWVRSSGRWGTGRRSIVDSRSRQPRSVSERAVSPVAISSAERAFSELRNEQHAGAVDASLASNGRLVDAQLRVLRQAKEAREARLRRQRPGELEALVTTQAVRPLDAGLKVDDEAPPLHLVAPYALEVVGARCRRAPPSLGGSRPPRGSGRHERLPPWPPSGPSAGARRRLRGHLSARESAGRRPK